MIDRLLQKLESPRRHLTLLVGLLALVFVLTAIVAWRASEADQARVNMANSALEEATSLTLGDWAQYYQGQIGASLGPAATRVADPSLSLDALRASITTKDICELCTTEEGVVSAFVIDAKSGASQHAGPPLPEDIVASLREQMLGGRSVPFHKRIQGGYYFFEKHGLVISTMAYLALDADSLPIRISGVVLSDALARELVEFTFSNVRGLPSAFAPHASSNQVFAKSATVGQADLLIPASEHGLEMEPVGPPVFGLTFHLGPRSTATELFEFGASRTAERTTIVVLMIVISALLATALLQVRREAELGRLRADFVSSVSHELRTPLAQIRMFTETLLLGRVRSDVERRRSLEIIDQEARRLAYLVENVLLFSKAEGGRASRVAPEPTHFADEIRHAVDSLSLLCRSRSVDVRTELQENITVPVDRMALRQILINLIDNALKYGPVGQRITVGAALFDSDARIWVDDEGPGIPVADRTRVFDSFYRLPREDQSRVSGSGIGLAVVRELARLHGGEAWAEAAPGRGARIVVQFPDAYLRSEETGDFAAAS